MKKKRVIVTRRDFIRGSAGAALGAALLGPAWLKAEAKAAGGQRSLVVIVRDAKAMDANLSVDKQAVASML
jgi:anaerobic selenocysteine-containing dehydrogenase